MKIIDEIRTDSFLYKYLYHWGNTPKRIDIYYLGCRFVIEPFIWLGMFLLVALIAIGASIAWLMWELAQIVFGFLFAARPMWFSSDYDRKEDFVDRQNPWLVHYKHWPKLRGSRIWPISILAICLITYLEYLSFNWRPILTSVVTVGLLVIFLIAYSVVFFFTKGESWPLMKESVVAWKRGFFREIKIIDNDKEDSNETVA